MPADSATRGTRVRASRTRPQKERISPGRCYGAETSPTVHARRKKWRANIYRRQLTKAGVRDNRKRCTRGSMRGPLRGSSRAVSATYSNQRRVPGPPHKVGRPIKANVSHKADTSTYSTGRNVDHEDPAHQRRQQATTFTNPAQQARPGRTSRTRTLT